MPLRAIYLIAPRVHVGVQYCSVFDWSKVAIKWDIPFIMLSRDRECSERDRQSAVNMTDDMYLFMDGLLQFNS